MIHFFPYDMSIHTYTSSPSVSQSNLLKSLKDKQHLIPPPPPPPPHPYLLILFTRFWKVLRIDKYRSILDGIFKLWQRKCAQAFYVFREKEKILLSHQPLTTEARAAACCSVQTSIILQLCLLTHLLQIVFVHSKSFFKADSWNCGSGSSDNPLM